MGLSPPFFFCGVIMIPRAKLLNRARRQDNDCRCFGTSYKNRSKRNKSAKRLASRRIRRMLAGEILTY